MASITREQAGRDPELCFTSLIDIVFLLLIFFMCASRFKQVEQKLDAFLPQSGDQMAVRSSLPPKELTIFVRDDAVMRGSANHNLKAMREATYYLESRGATPVHDPRIMLPRLRQLAADQDLRVLIAPYDESMGRDQLVPFFNVVKVVDICKAAGIGNIAFQAPREAD